MRVQYSTWAHIWRCEYGLEALHPSMNGALAGMIMKLFPPSNNPLSADMLIYTKVEILGVSYQDSVPK